MLGFSGFWENWDRQKWWVGDRMFQKCEFHQVGLHAFFLLGLRMDNPFAVEQRKRPELRGRPSAVVQFNPWKGGGLIAVSYEARRAGVTRFVLSSSAQLNSPGIFA